MAFYFDGDDYDPGGRGERTRAILAGRRLPHLVVDKPAGLRTNWAAATPTFAKLYAGCILGFIATAEMNEQAQCAEGAFVGGADRVPPGPSAAQRAALALRSAGQNAPTSR